MRSEPLDDTDPIGPLADEVEAGHGPVALVRPGHKPVVLVSAEHWAHLLELESEEETAWWKRDASERAKHGEAPEDGEDEPGIDETEFRRRFAHLLPPISGVA
jgi:PHD/YefM family antitoxin component YafN of YafNO toxin-antitoxin module